MVSGSFLAEAREGRRAGWRAAARHSGCAGVGRARAARAAHREGGGTGHHVAPSRGMGTAARSGAGRSDGGVGPRTRAVPSAVFARFRALVLVVNAALALLSLAPPAEGVGGTRRSDPSLRELEGRLEGKVSDHAVRRAEAVPGDTRRRQRGERNDGVAASSDWWPEEGDCSAMLAGLASVHVRRNYLSASGEEGGDAKNVVQEGFMPVSFEPRHFVCDAHRARGALLSAEAHDWPSAARDKATGAAVVRAADSASVFSGAKSGGGSASTGDEAERALIYWMHERKAGGDLVKGCMDVPTKGHNFGFYGKDEEIPFGRQEYCNRSQSLLANTSALTVVTEYFAPPVMCMHDEAVMRHTSFVAVVRHPLFRWQSELSWSSAIAKLDGVWQLFAEEPPPLGGCEPGRPCTGSGGIREYLRPGKLSPRSRERISDAQLEAAMRSLRSWMDNTWDGGKRCRDMRDKDMKAAGPQDKALSRAGHITESCYIDNYLVRLLSQNCSCDVGLLQTARRASSDTLYLHTNRDGCGINYHRRVTYEDFLLARQAAASFNALVPLERLQCDAKRVFALLGGNTGASMHPDFSLPSGSHVSTLEIRVLEVPELRAMLEADNMYDLVSLR